MRPKASKKEFEIRGMRRRSAGRGAGTVQEAGDHRRSRLRRSSTSATKRSSDFIAFLGRLDAIYRPCPGRPDKPVVFVLDNGPIHPSKASQATLAARAWLTIEWLPKYAPELNDIERSWRDLKRHFLAHQTFAAVDHLGRAIHKAICRHEPRAPITPVY
jgi:hypothetical protein